MLGNKIGRERKENIKFFPYLVINGNFMGGKERNSTSFI